MEFQSVIHVDFLSESINQYNTYKLCLLSSKIII